MVSMDTKALTPNIKNEAAAVSCLSLASGGLIAGMSALTGNILIGIPGIALGTTLAFIGYGNIRKHRLLTEDFKPVPTILIDSIGATFTDPTMTVIGKPVVEAGLGLLGVKKQDHLANDLAVMQELLTRHSSLLSGGTGYGKSYLMTLILALACNRDPNARFFICSTKPWNRSHSWGGLKFQPDDTRFQFITEGSTKRAVDQLLEIKADGDLVKKAPISRATPESLDSDFSNRIMLEYDQVVCAYYQMLQERKAEDTRTKAEATFFPAYLVLDEEPAYISWCKTQGTKFFDDRKGKIDALFREGDGLSMWGLCVAQADAVGETGITEATQRNLYFANINPTLPMLNSPGGRLRYPGGEEQHPHMQAVGERVLFIGAKGSTRMVGIPEMPQELQLDWSNVQPLDRDLNAEWLERVDGLIRDFIGSGKSMSATWGAIKDIHDRPGVASQGRGDEPYQSFKKQFALIKREWEVNTGQADGGDEPDPQPV